MEAQRTAQGGREVLFFVHNACDMPIYEVSLPTPDEDDDEAEFIGLVPPGQTIQRPAPREWLATYYAPEPVEIEFLDSSGRQWTRNEQGFLAPTGDDTPTPRAAAVQAVSTRALTSATCARRPRRRPRDRPMHHMIGRVPVQDLRDPLLHVDRLAVRAGRHVAVGQRRHRERRDVSDRELRGQHFAETAFLGLDLRARVVRHQRPHCSIAEPTVAQVASAVEWMKPAVRPAAWRSRCRAAMPPPRHAA